ncbi:blastula protease 10 [Nematostella vectensis]|uniref:blastula protease 10 n=1 Tax=Nematostella vectensis TaxID=45351 RepID=UPI0020777DA1|nr:blastula protease 10 [Nematostella vectensis]
MERLLILLILSAAAFASVEENRGIEEEEELFEGDIKLTEEQMNELNSRAAMKTRKWPGGVVPYELDSSLSGESRAVNAINAAIAEYAKLTCIKLRPKKAGDNAYLSIFKGSGCWSFLGRIGRKQQLSLAGGCWYKGIVIHEIAHALGFFHEQSRPDRDQYVKIMFENIKSGREGNFRKNSASSVTTHNTPYDYGSVMHYSGRAFTKNGKPTIVPLKSGVYIGQRGGLSPLDVKQVNIHYNCGGISPSPVTKPPPQSGFNCNFDSNMCSFVNMGSDKFDWTRRSGGTPSWGTGPSSGHGGKGSYMYIEASSPRKQNDNAKMMASITFDGNTCVSFYYHMYGKHVGKLVVSVGTKTYLTLAGSQGNAWKQASFKLSAKGNFPVVFEGVVGKAWQGDIAIDDVSVKKC